MRPEKHERHILLNGLQLKCGICDNNLDEAEKIVALAGNKSTTALHKGFLNPFGTDTWEQQRAHKVLIDEKWLLCRVQEYDCHAFHGSQARRYGCAFHEGCFQVFVRHYPEYDGGESGGGGAELLDRLWQACVWARVPWTGARVPELRLVPARKSAWKFLGTFVSCAAQCGMAWLGELPEPVVVSIMEMVPRECEFWRCVAALDMARRLAVQPGRRLRTVPLNWLVSWERGEAPVLATEEQVEALPSLVRLTVDVDGVRKFERLATRPAFTTKRYDDRAFVIDEEGRFGVAVVHLKNDRLQLAMLNDMEEPGLAVWDTPTPPDLSRCSVRPVRSNSAMRYHTIDLGTVTGLTFFHIGRDILAIHAHCRTRPCAMETFETLSNMHQRVKKYIHWIYVPLPQQDTILSCSPLVDRSNIHNKTARVNIMFRTLLSGEFTVGRYKPSWHDAQHNVHKTATYSFLLNDPKHPPTTLIYSNGPSREGTGASPVVPYSGAYDRDQVTTTLAEPETYPLPEKDEYREHSEASLENVWRARVYYGTSILKNSLPGRVAGLLLFYRNGGQRALGECRIGVDPFTTFDEPERIAFAYTYVNEFPVGVNIRFEPCVRARGQEPRPTEEDEEAWSKAAWAAEKWFRYEMKGRLAFWFSYSEYSHASVEIIGGRTVEEEVERGNGEGGG
ncbi:hypothetical protein VTI74DRAFT_4262 [Chaetomium olivicolor]